MLYYRARTLHSISFNLSVKHPAKEWEYQSEQSKGHNRSQYYIGEAGGIRRWYLPGYVVKEQLYLHVHPFLRALFFFLPLPLPLQSSPHLSSCRSGLHSFFILDPFRGRLLSTLSVFFFYEGLFLADEVVRKGQKHRAGLLSLEKVWDTGTSPGRFPPHSSCRKF